MKFDLTVVAVDAKTATSAKGKPYQLVELAYKNNTFQGKLESAKINQYSNVFKQVSGMLPGQSYTVEKEKDDSGYYQWLSVTQLAPGTTSSVQTSAAPTSAAQAVRSTYETPEERSAKQVYIVKQSAIAQAVASLSVGAKNPPSTDQVLDRAQEYVDFVFDKPKPISLAEMENDLVD